MLTRELTDPSVVTTTSGQWSSRLTMTSEEGPTRNENVDEGEQSGPVMLHGYHGRFPLPRVSFFPVDRKQILSASPTEIRDVFRAEAATA